jgi:GntR family transcriptional repressor for pyruvate dehydrogenase complex
VAEGNDRHQFQRISSERSFEIVLRQIRDAIERGLIKPGDKLPAEPDLAAEFGVSRSVLREALKVLELSGYLEIRRGYRGGTFVSNPIPDEFTVIPAPPIPILSVSPRDLMEVRTAIEPRAAWLAAASDLEAVKGLHEAIRDMEIFDDRPAHVLAAATDFHVAVARASANSVFAPILESLRPVMYMAMNPLVQIQEWRERCRADHERIAKEIEAGHPDQAEEAMREHLWLETEVDPDRARSGDGG